MAEADEALAAVPRPLEEHLVHTSWRAIRIALLVGVLSVAGSTGVARPVSAAGPETLTGIVQLSAGSQHVCARLSNGQVRCWGNNEHGQLGDGTRDERHAATPVLDRDGTGPLRDVQRISAGNAETCAVLRTGRALCWGANDRGQLGDGTRTERLLPVLVSNPRGTGPLEDVVAIASGGVTTCALLASRQVRCWGYGGSGALGNGSIQDRRRPVVVMNPSGTGPLKSVVEVVSGSTPCARVTSGELRCWGYDGNGQIGNGEPKTGTNTLPRSVKKPAGRSGVLTSVRGMATSGHVCAATQPGRALCWGPELFGILGNGATDGERTRPVIVRDADGSGLLSGVTDIAARYRNSCARLAERRVACWGSNEKGELGDGDTYPHSALPVMVWAPGGGRLSNVASVTVGALFACARLRDRTARCWGWNAFGQLGDASTDDAHLPVMVMTSSS